METAADGRPVSARARPRGGARHTPTDATSMSSVESCAAAEVVLRASSHVLAGERAAIHLSALNSTLDAAQLRVWLFFNYTAVTSAVKFNVY